MTHAAQFGEWYYLIFLLPGLLAVALLLVSAAFSLGGDSEADGETADDGETEDDGETDTESEGEDGGGAGAGMLRLIGADKAPLSLTGGAFFLGWGFFGFWANELLMPWLPGPARFLGPALAAALAGAILTARAMAAVAQRVIPKDGKEALSPEALTGHEARAVYPISESAGRAFYYDRSAVLHDLTCRVRPGEPPIPKGQKIILVGYEPKTRRFWAEPSPFEDN